MAAETAIVEISVYKRILCEFRDAVNGCIRSRSAILGILEEKRANSSSGSSAVCSQKQRRGAYEIVVFRKQTTFSSSNHRLKSRFHPQIPTSLGQWWFFLPPITRRHRNDTRRRVQGNEVDPQRGILAFSEGNYATGCQAHPCRPQPCLSAMLPVNRRLDVGKHIRLTPNNAQGQVERQGTHSESFDGTASPFRCAILISCMQSEHRDRSLLKLESSGP